MPRACRVAVVILAALAAWPLTAQTIFVDDQFTVAANTMLEAHPPNTGIAWTRYIGNGATINAAADNLRNVSTGDWTIYSNATAPNAEHVVGVLVRFTNNNTNNFVQLFGRGSAALQAGYLVQYEADGTLTLIRYNAGTPTVLATTNVAVALNTDIHLVLSLKNAAKEVWVNGTLRLTSANNATAGTGFVGLGMQSNNANQVILDRFFAATFAPTAIDRLDASATRAGARTLLEWTTSREAGNLGFRVHREERGRRVRASSQLIAGAAFLVSGAMLPAGHTYRWLDEGRAAKYWIEEIDLHGRSRWHGPIVPRRGAIEERVAISPALNRLAQHDGVPAEPVAIEPAARRRIADPAPGSVARQFELAAGDALRIGVREEGIHRITREELLGLDPRAVRLYADGSEVATLADDDGILFYGRPLDTASTDTRIYWLPFVATASAGEPPPSPPAKAGATKARRSFLATAERRDRTLFAATIRNPRIDGFVGPVVSTDPALPTIQTLRLRHLDRDTALASLTVTLQGASDSEGDEDHRVTVSLNGQAAGELAFNGQEEATASFAIETSRLLDGENVVALVAQNGEADVSVVLSVAITYARLFVAGDDQLLATVDGGRQSTITGFSGDDVRVFDVTVTSSPVRIAATANAGAITFTVPGHDARTILALRPSRFLRPAFITKNVASSLHDARADVVLVSHPTFVDALAPLVELRRAQGLRVTVATTDDVFDEYAFGAKDPHAIRAFLDDVRPRYALLVGDASFDPRDRLGIEQADYVPTQLVITDLLRTASDTWLADFDDDGAADLPIGRLPVRTLAEARAQIAKIVAYETSSQPRSKRVLLVTDGDPSLDFPVATAAVRNELPAGFEVVDIDASAVGTNAAREELLGRFDGSLLVNYIGHGSVERWSGEGLFTRNDATALDAGGRLPIVVAMTCLNGYFHDLYTESLAEALLRAEGGAVAVWASTGLTSPEAQVPVNEVLLRALLGSAPTIRLGDAVLEAHRSATTPDIRRTFLLFGDPAMLVRVGD